MNHEIQFGTDTATLGIFDPQILKHRVDDECDWWCADLGQVEEVKDGKICLMSLGGDGCFKVRITDEELLPEEESYAAVHMKLGLEVISGKIMAGPGEYLPGGGLDCKEDDEQYERFFFPVPNGSYDLDVYGINWHDAVQWYVPDGESVTEGTPVDVVVVLKPRTGKFQAPAEEPRFTGIEDTWVFPDKERELGPTPGMVMSATVVKRVDKLVLRQTGPKLYRPILADMSGLQKKDEIKVKIISIDHEKEEMQVERVDVPKNDNPGESNIHKNTEVIKKLADRVKNGPQSTDIMDGVIEACPPCSMDIIEKAEGELGFSLPDILKEIYTSVANGGFGPGYGIIGVDGGFADDTGASVVKLYQDYHTPDPDEPSWQWPEGWLPICHWGCIIYTIVDCSKPPYRVIFVSIGDRDEGQPIDELVIESRPSLTEWFEDWLNGADFWKEAFGGDEVEPETPIYNKPWWKFW